LAIFDDLRSKLRQTQQDYMKHVVKDTKGIARINSDEQKTIRNDMNWTRDSSYKLSMYQRSSLEDLSVLAFSAAKLLTFDVKKSQTTDIDFFTQLKDIALKRLNKCIFELENTKLFNWVQFHSRLCYTLLAASNKSFNKNFNDR